MKSYRSYFTSTLTSSTLDDINKVEKYHIPSITYLNFSSAQLGTPLSLAIHSLAPSIYFSSISTVSLTFSNVLTASGCSSN